MLFDSHCHLTAEAFDEDRETVVSRAREAGVERLVTIASNPDDAEEARRLARAWDGVWCTAGLHPHDADRASPAILRRIRAMLDAPEVVAVGECGLDFHYDHAPREVQRDTFRAQVAMAADTGLPLVVHCRDADDEMRLELAHDAGRVTGVLHCFTGGDALLDDALSAGWYVSFSGIVTFRRFDGAEQVRRVPSDRILIETDAPYLAPVPRRGRRNEPAYLRHTAEVLAEVRGESLAELARSSADNAARFYGLDGEHRE